MFGKKEEEVIGSNELSSTNHLNVMFELPILSETYLHL